MAENILLIILGSFMLPSLRKSYIYHVDLPFSSLILFLSCIFFCSDCWKSRQIGGGARCLQTCLERLQGLCLGSWWAQAHFQVLWRVVRTWFDTYWFSGHYVDSWPKRRYCLYFTRISHLAVYILLFYSKYGVLHTSHLLSTVIV